MPFLNIGGLAEVDFGPDRLLTVSQEQETKGKQEVWMDTALLWMKESSNFGISCPSTAHPSLSRGRSTHARLWITHYRLHTPSLIIAGTENNVGATFCCLVPPRSTVPAHPRVSPSFPTLLVSGSCKCRSSDVAHVGKRKGFRGYR